MKLLKSILFIVTMVVAQPISARNVSKEAPPAKTDATTPAQNATRPGTLPAQNNPLPPIPTAPALPPRDLPSRNSFQYQLQQVRYMKPTDVINAQGIFTDSFKKFVQSSGLAPEFMETLFQAGRNLHLPLEGNNNQDLATIDYAGENINRLMTNNVPSIGKDSVDSTAAFYNRPTRLFNQDYLNKYVANYPALGTLSKKDAEDKVIRDLQPRIIDAWKKNNIPITPMLIEEMRKQIIMTINKEFTKWRNPQASAPQKEWYNGWTTRLINTQYLEKFVGDALRLNKTASQYEKELDALEKKVKMQWEEEGITGQAKDELAPLLNKQLEETANAIEQKRSLKKQSLNGLENQAKKINKKYESSEEIILPMPIKKVPQNAPGAAIPKPKTSPHAFIKSQLMYENRNTDELYKLFKENTKDSYIFEPNGGVQRFFIDLITTFRSTYPNLTKENTVAAIKESLQAFFAENSKQFTITSSLTRTLNELFDLISQQK